MGKAKTRPLAAKKPARGKPAAKSAPKRAVKATPAPKKAKPAPKAKAAPTAKAKAAPRAPKKAKPAAKGTAAIPVAAELPEADRAATEAKVASTKAATEAIVAKVKRENPTTTPGMEPFVLAETSPGRYSLLLSTFDAAAPAFETSGIDAGGYAWEGVARYVVENDAAALGERIQFDPEASMFCAYGDDRAGLEDLGKRLSTLYHDLPRLTEMVKTIGPAGFDN
jgi:hypothetical protein